MDAAPTSISAGPPRIGRRTYVVDKGFQLKYTLLLALTGAVVSAVFGCLMYAAHLEARRTVEAYRSLVPSEWLKLQLAQGETTMLWLVAGVTVMMAAALALFGIFLTHRVAGPVYVMMGYMAVLSKGRFPKMRPLRKRDELKELFDQFQGAVEVLRQREAEDAKRLEDAVEAFTPLASTSQARAALDALKAVQQRKKAALGADDAAKR